NSVDEMYFRFVTMLRVPQGERNSWIFTLIYASDEEIFGEVLPIPGLAYAWVPSDQFTAVIGFSFSLIRLKPWESLTLEAEYYPFWTVRSRITWEIFQPLRAYGGFQWDSDHFYRADREDKADKIFYREMRLYAGVRFDLKHIGFDVTGGYAFNRFYFEGEGYKDRHDNRIDVGDTWFIVGKVTLRFLAASRGAHGAATVQKLRERPDAVAGTAVAPFKNVRAIRSLATIAGLAIIVFLVVRVGSQEALLSAARALGWRSLLVCL